MNLTAPETLAPDTPRRKVLVVDDDAILREVMAEQFAALAGPS